MDLLSLTLGAVNKAFAITKPFQAEVTFQLQIVWNLDPVHDTASEAPSYTKTVPAVVYKPFQRRNDPVYYHYTESLCVQQWTDAPPPSVNDRTLITTKWGTFLRQLVSVSEDPAHAVWLIETRMPTKQ